MAGTILIAGSLAQRPGQGGHTWVFLQYLLGFRRLGWDVLFLDWLSPAMCVDEAGAPCAFQNSVNLRYFQRVMTAFGLDGAFSLDYNQGEQVVGIPRGAVLERAQDAAFLLNVMGFLQDEAILDAVSRRVFLDIDPGFGQMWYALGLGDLFHGHDAFVTIGERIGQVDCAIPTCGLDWLTTPPPVVLDRWPAAEDAPHHGQFTSIASWRGPFGPIDYQGCTYGLRVHEFRKFFPLPQASSAPFELALAIHPAEEKDRAALAAHGWRLTDPVAAAADPWKYRAYIRASMAEFMVAKNMYVQARSGWLSDRSLCYLASGRPVVAQDTGFRDRYPTGEGLLPFSTLEEAAEAVEAVRRDYRRHARAARRLAETCFDSDVVLTRLLNELRVGTTLTV